MTNAGANFDSNAFEQQVLEAVEDIMGPRERVVRKKTGKRKASGDSRRTRKGVSDTKLNILHGNAQVYLKKKEISRYVCAGLRGVTKDVTSIAKALVVILVPLSIAGKITIPMDPYGFAMIAYVIWKFGVEAFCADKK